MTHGVHPIPHGVQPPHFDAVIHRTIAHPQANQLSPPHHPMLLGGKSRYLPINQPSPSQPTYIGV